MKGEAMDAKRYNRHLVIEQTEPTLKVSFFWHEGDSEYIADRTNFKELEFYPINMQSACNALDVFFMHGFKFRKINDAVYVVSDNVDFMNYYFDGVVDSEEPEQMFISKYILEDAMQRSLGFRGDRHD